MAAAARDGAFEHRLRVRYGECDPQGIVFNANYLLYFDIAITELWRAAVGSWRVLTEHGVDLVVGEANVRFRSPARFDDELSLRPRVVELGRTSLTTEVQIRRGDELLVEGWERHVCVDAQTWAKTELPEWIREAMAPFRGARGDGAGAAQPSAGGGPSTSTP